MKIILLYFFAILFFACQSIYDGTGEGDNPEPPIPPDQYSHLGLVAYFPFDGDLNDYCDTTNFCIDLSDSVYVNGVSGQAKDFNGETDMLRLNKTLHGGYGLTFSFWCNSRGVKNGQENGVIIGKYNRTPSGRCFIISTQATGEVNDPSLRGNFYHFGNTSNYVDGIYSNIENISDMPTSSDSTKYTLHNPMSLPLNEWVHCVINVSDSTMEAWINGTLTVSLDRSYDTYHDKASISTYIGNLPNAGYGENNHYNGAVDELRIYNRPLSVEEIQTLYENPDGAGMEE